MSRDLTAWIGARVFDGTTLQAGRALLVSEGCVAGIVGPGDIPPDAVRTDLPGGILAPGFVDIQVNGGGGVMFNAEPDVETLRHMAEAHARLGTCTMLPTLITDTPSVTRAAIKAVTDAVAQRVPGIAGLHLEGPHLSVARKGAHDARLIRAMTDADLALLRAAATRLPVLMLTLAPESVTPDQIRRLADDGAVLSLGHSDCSHAGALAAVAAGASAVTHLFNAMSPLGSREPGLVGAALGCGALSAGLIGDLVHVHPDTIRLALAAKRGPGRVFLVSDAMAVAGSDLDHFTLNGRRIERRDGRLTLDDGTLAGADLDLVRAVANLVGLGVGLDRALAMATSIPAAVIGLDGPGRLRPGGPADFVWLGDDLTLRGVWRGGVAKAPFSA